ncbi:hypothetical protein [Paraburkholderia tuberum]|uniref:Uncharacterized protein n=1 Tax=Paraburkholderia tuberum TaxID=157910 RepID=A0A1H1GV97_9BURK|nr:hypothetical protein [Paraburkholderia tuberum]SDR17003.1 hypothetical protein SAMN05445850_3101 [Paraburkholderia tuberum]
MNARLLLGRAPSDNALLASCPRTRRRLRALATMLAYGVAAGTFLWLVVALRAGGSA